MDAVIAAHRRGDIILWSGTIATIRPGWQLCDGTNGTPDLRDKFVVGAGNTYDPADTGGSVNHDHGYVGPGHNHAIVAGEGVAAGTDFENVTGNAVSFGTTAPSDGQPPYYALAYIMKL